VTTRTKQDAASPHLFGPVPSRRLGYSLGIDLVPHKVCTLDCVYCEVGHTTKRTLQRQEWVPTAEVEAELEAWLVKDGQADYLTFSGYGEPTLHSDIQHIIRFLKDRTTTPLALLTNGTLFWMPEVRREVAELDLIMPSLDAADPDTFTRINRPHPDLDVERVIEGLVALRREFEGQIWLEVLLVSGINDADAELDRIAEAVARIDPDKVQLNTVARPGSEAWAVAASLDVQERARDVFGERCEVVADFQHTSKSPCAPQPANVTERILGVILRRPETQERLADALGVALPAVEAAVAALLEQGRVRLDERNGQRFVLPAAR